MRSTCACRIAPALPARPRWFVAQRIAGLGQIAKVHLLEGPAKQVLVGHGEIQAVQWDAQGLPLKGASNVRVHPFLGPGHGLLVFFIADAVFQLNDQMAVGFRHAAALGVHHEHALPLASRGRAPACRPAFRRHAWCPPEWKSRRCRCRNTPSRRLKAGFCLVTEYNRALNFMLAAGQPVLLNQSAAAAKKDHADNKGPEDAERTTCRDAFMAVSSLRSARLPMAMMEATSTASGRARLTKRAEANTMSLNTTHNSRPLPIMSSA